MEKRLPRRIAPFTPFPCGAAHNAGEGGLMSISRSRDCIHSSCSGHSSSSSRNRADCSFRRGSEGVGRVVDRWIACIFTANHAKRRLVPSRRIDCGDWSLPRVLRRRYCSVHRLAARRAMRAAPPSRRTFSDGRMGDFGTVRDDTPYLTAEKPRSLRNGPRIIT